MTINYTTLLGLAKPVTGTETGQWGDIVNDEITSLLEDSIAKSVTLSVTSANVTLTTSNGATNQARMATLIITGTPGTTRNIIAPSKSKIYQVINQSDSPVVIKGAATTGATILAGASGVVAWNGSDFIEIGAIASNRTINGALQLSAGTAAAPSLTTTGDTNTGLYFPAADTVGVAVGGVNVGNFTSAGFSGNAATATNATNLVNGNATLAAGTAAAPSLTTTGDTNTGVYFPAADTVAIATGGVKRVEVDANGNLGLGVTPSAWVSGAKAIELFNNQGSLSSFAGPYGQINLSSNAYGTGSADIGFTTWRYARGTVGDLGAAGQYRITGANHTWYTAPSGTAGNAISFTQSMTLDASGNLLVGTTSAVDLGKVSVLFPVGSANGISLRTSGTSYNYNLMSFLAGPTQVGYIFTNGTTTSYGTSSDYRLKENIQPMTGALAKVAQLKPCTYHWKLDGSDGQGFIAHELAEVCPDAVTGEKDGVDAEGNPKYQGIDTSFLVATLTAAIQELNAKFEEYKAAHV